MMSSSDLDLRFKNPFREGTSTELIEDPLAFSRLFSHEILVNETLDVFEKDNIVLTGPQGTGKTMILCLFRHTFLNTLLAESDRPAFLENVSPFCGISIHLIRSGFHVFGRRSMERREADDEKQRELDSMCAADYLTHWLFRQFLGYLEFLMSRKAKPLRAWLGIEKGALRTKLLAKQMANWECWRGYYSAKESIRGLMDRCMERLEVWQDFLNANIDTVPEEIWRTKATPFEDPFHRMGRLVSGFNSARRPPLFVIIDQYEVLPELNPRFGTHLQRIVNTLIKGRDPYVFFKIGARPYDWGRELRIWGTESRVEVDRDYKTVDLTSILLKGENKAGWLFPKFAEDVAFRRLSQLNLHKNIAKDHIQKLFGTWNAKKESAQYEPKRHRDPRLYLKGVPAEYHELILTACGSEVTPLDLRLASAWIIQSHNRFVRFDDIQQAVQDSPVPWLRESWRKERIEIALLQIASFTNQRKQYYGWDNVKFLCGSDIRAFLRICEEVWEVAAKLDPSQLLSGTALKPSIQTEGIFEASHFWRLRDRREGVGGSRRYAALSRLGPAIHGALISDLAISNPGHTGFSVSESELHRDDDERATAVSLFLGNANNWAIMEERPHTSKEKHGGSRAKWFLHPILSPAFGIPIRRIKEPYYTSVDHVYNWLFTDESIKFGTGHRKRSPRSRLGKGDPSQMNLPLGE